MKISILAFDLSTNSLVRTHVIAQLLQRNHEIEIIGPMSTGEIWEPLRNEYDYHGITMSPRVYSFASKVNRIRRAITGDVIYARKPKLQSLGIGLFERFRSHFPLVVDIEDWELGFIYENTSRWMAPVRGIPELINVNSYYYTRAMETLADTADAITVSNRFLLSRFGGTLIPHVRDTTEFDPARFDQTEVRARLGLPEDDILVMFSGTPHPHKGIEELVTAVSQLGRPEVRTVLVGAEESTYLNRLRAIGGESLIVRGPQSFKRMPEWVCAADIVVVPQRPSTALQGQIPAKLFDAMAMAKPVIATDVSDIKEVLADTGVVIDNPTPEVLADTIGELASDSELRVELGRKARRRCVEHYSIDAYVPVMESILGEATAHCG